MILALYLVGCAPSLTSPSEPDGGSSGGSPAVAGTYQATMFTVTTATNTVSVLEEGGGLDLTLFEDGESAGLLLVPEGVPVIAPEGGGDLEADMEGTWDLSGDGLEVTLDQPADTFIRDTVFEVRSNQLVGSILVRDEALVEITLQRTGPP